MVKYNTVVYSRSDYDDSEDKLFEVVNTQLRLLLNAGYLAVVRYDADRGLGIVVIEYEHDERLDPWGIDNPMWVSPEEEDLIIARREDNSMEVRSALDD